jgi:hypothetical protein
MEKRLRPDAREPDPISFGLRCSSRSTYLELGDGLFNDVFRSPPARVPSHDGEPTREYRSLCEPSARACRVPLGRFHAPCQAGYSFHEPAFRIPVLAHLSRKDLSDGSYLRTFSITLGPQFYRNLIYQPESSSNSACLRPGALISKTMPANFPHHDADS